MVDMAVSGCTGERPNVFDEALDEEQRAILAAYWRARGVGEMGAEVAFSYVAEDLEALGAPSEVLALARRAVQDERRHGLWGRDWAVRFGHPDRSEPRAKRTRRMVLPGAGERGNRLLRVAFCCLTETVGCQVLQQIRPRIVHPELRKLNQRHLSDEVQHARVGWAQLSLLAERDKRFLREWLPLLFRLLPQACCDGPEQDYDELVPFGYFTPQVLRTGHDAAVRDVIVPGLQHLGILEAA